MLDAAAQPGRAIRNLGQAGYITTRSSQALR